MRTRRRRRRASVARTYTIGHLLAKQPKGLKRVPGFDAMMAHYHASEALQRLRMSRRCYGLLANARIAPNNLPVFYRTYKALKTATINSANLLGVDSDCGSIEVGKKADLVICDQSQCDNRASFKNLKPSAFS